MKIFIGSNLIAKILFTVTVLLSQVQSADPNPGEIARGVHPNPYPISHGHQRNVFPDRSNPPTGNLQFPYANYTAPKLSQSLQEVDPNTKMRRQDFIQFFKYTLYNLTRGEAEQIFLFADIDHDDLVSSFEWDNFIQLFILPFEACDTNNDYLLDHSEFAQCFNKDPNSEFLRFRRRHETYKYRMILSVLETRGRDSIDFNEYLFLRKSMFGWRQCHSNAKYIAVMNFQCAFRLAVPQKYVLKTDYEMIYQTGMRMANDNSMIQLDFLNYLRTLYVAYYFTVFGSPQENPYLDKQQFIKAVHEDKLPNNFDENEINTMYALINTNPFHEIHTMTFPNFYFFFNLHQLFNKYSHEKPMLLTRDEVTYLLNDTFAPVNTTLSIDVSKTHFTQQQYLEASLILQKLRPNEKDFFYTFLETTAEEKGKFRLKSLMKHRQDASAQRTATNDNATTNSTYYDLYTNFTNRQTFFSTMADVRKRFWTKGEFYRSFQLCNLFTSMVEDVRRIVSVPIFLEKLNTQYDTVVPPMNIDQRKTYEFYKFLPKEIYLDILTFLALENFSHKLDTEKISSNKKVHETQLRIVLNDYGMESMPDTVLDIAKLGYDSLKRRIYDYRKIIRYCIIVHAVAAEQQRNMESAIAYNLPENHEPSRQYPYPPRRFNVTELV